MTTLHAIWEKRPLTTPTATSLATEEERWEALIQDADPYILQSNPHKYGPLTAEGFKAARASPRYQYNDKWPSSPIEVSSLLHSVGATEKNCIDLITFYNGNATYRMEQWADSVAFQTLYALLERLKVQAKSPYLARLLKVHQWGSRNNNQEIGQKMDALSAIRSFFSNNKDMDAVLGQWLNHMQPGATPSRTSSLGTAIAQHFPEAEVEPLWRWSEKHQDLQALAYLVAQGRAPLKGWLMALATISTSGIEENRRRHPREQYRDIRYDEINACLLALLTPGAPTYLGKQTLQEQSTQIRELDDAALVQLLNIVPPSDSQVHAMTWVATLAGAGLLDIERAPVQAWLMAATNAQNDLVDALINSTSGSRGKLSITEAWFANWGPQVAGLSPAWRELMATYLLLNTPLTQTEEFLERCGNLEWLSEVSVPRLILALKSEKSLNSPEKLLIELMPLLAEEHMPVLGASVVKAVATNRLKTRTLLSRWRAKNPERFGKPISSQYASDDVTHLLYALVRQDPASFITTMRELGLKKRDEGFEGAVKTWLESQSGIEHASAPLPDIGFN